MFVYLNEMPYILNQWSVLNSVGNKIPYIANQSCSFQLQVCLSIFDFLLPLLFKELTLFRPGAEENGFCFRSKFL